MHMHDKEKDLNDVISKTAPDHDVNSLPLALSAADHLEAIKPFLLISYTVFDLSCRVGNGVFT